jgi:hypothetical protein
MKNKFIIGLILLIAAFLGGFVPQHMRLSEAESQIVSLRQQLDGQKQATTLADLRNDTALLYNELSRSNYSVAGDRATKLFTALRQFTDQAPDPLKQKLEHVLLSRDTIIAAIAKADPGSAGLVQSMFLELQGS